jgi:integrase/recombinase XerD
MELVWANEDLLIAGRPYPGFPIVLWDTMDSCVPANEFMRHYLLRGSIGSERSWPSTGRALYDFFSFLQVHELDWHDVDRGEAKGVVAAYRDYCLIECELARSTTRQRLHYICKLYEYGLQQGWVSRLPFGHEERTVKREPSFLAHVDASGGKAMVNDIMPRRHRALPKFLSMDEVRRLLVAAENPHHRIVVVYFPRTPR